MKGFLPDKVLASRKPESKKPECSRCGLHKHCASPKMEVQGKGKRRILVVDAYPSSIDDEDGRFFAGRDGILLASVMRRYGIDLLRDCWLTAGVICKPEKEPTAEQYQFCSPNLRNTIASLQPDAIVVFDPESLRSIFGRAWTDIGGFARWVGWQIPLQSLNTWVLPMYSPRHVRKFERDKALQTIFDQQVSRLAEVEGKPWDVIPDFKKSVTVLFDSDDSCAVLRKTIARGKPVAFDYETNALKPDSALAQIACVAIAVNPQRSFAFPLTGSVSQPFRDFLISDVPKIGANLQFENRWSLAKFGVKVRGWLWDTVHAAHVLDNRPDITSVKFQTFVRIGQPLYNTKVDSFLDTGGSGNTINRINEVDQFDLLQYCGLDALFEFRVAQSQMKEMGLDFPA